MSSFFSNIFSPKKNEDLNVIRALQHQLPPIILSNPATPSGRRTSRLKTDIYLKGSEEMTLGAIEGIIDNIDRMSSNELHLAVDNIMDNLRAKK